MKITSKVLTELLDAINDHLGRVKGKQGYLYLSEYSAQVYGRYNVKVVMRVGKSAESNWFPSGGACLTKSELYRALQAMLHAWDTERRDSRLLSFYKAEED